MKAAPENIDDLIASYLAEEATPADRTRVDEWRALSSENQQYFDQLRLIFEKATANALRGADEVFDTDVAWQRMRTRLSSNGGGKTISIQSPNKTYHFFLRVAAGIIVVLGIGFFVYKGLSPDAERILLVTQDATASDTLPDGTDVFLNRQTEIEYVIRRDMHIAKLSGEAFFDIQHDADETFLVEAEETFIRDIGTSFNVKAYPGSPTIEVFVEEGEVIFYTKDSPGITLKANEKGTYHKATKRFTVSAPEANDTAYKSKHFVFTNNQLGTIVETLNSVYTTKIVIGDHLRSCRLTVSFNNETIDEIADIIAETLGLSVSRSANVITLKGPACGSKQP